MCKWSYKDTINLEGKVLNAVGSKVYHRIKQEPSFYINFEYGKLKAERLNGSSSKVVLTVDFNPKYAEAFSSKGIIFCISQKELISPNFASNRINIDMNLFKK